MELINSEDVSDLLKDIERSLKLNLKVMNLHKLSISENYATTLSTKCSS